jgi:BMFP domain-containing protein YqiC
MQRNERDYRLAEESAKEQREECEAVTAKLKDEMQSQESELQIMKYEKSTLEQRIDVRQRVKLQELETKMLPLSEERD